MYEQAKRNTVKTTHFQRQPTLGIKRGTVSTDGFTIIAITITISTIIYSERLLLL